MTFLLTLNDSDSLLSSYHKIKNTEKVFDVVSVALIRERWNQILIELKKWEELGKLMKTGLSY